MNKLTQHINRKNTQTPVCVDIYFLLINLKQHDYGF